jgi:hypothetical protein
VAAILGAVLLAHHSSPPPPVPTASPVQQAGLSTAALQRALLTSHDVPSNYPPLSTTTFAIEQLAICGSAFPSGGFQREADNSYGNASTGPYLSSGVASFAAGDGKRALDSVAAESAACTPLPNVLFGVPATTTVALRTGAPISGTDQVLRLTETTKSASLTVVHDLVLMRHGDVIEVIQYDGISAGDPTLVDSVAAAVAPRLEQLSG